MWRLACQLRPTMPLTVTPLLPPHAVILTAVGDPVNTTSRVQEATKHFGCQLVVSEASARLAGLDLSAFPVQQMEVRGRTQPLSVHPIPTSADLPEIRGGEHPAPEEQSASGNR